MDGNLISLRRSTGKGLNEAVTLEGAICVKIQGTRVSERGNNKFKAQMKNEESVLYLKNR